MKTNKPAEISLSSKKYDWREIDRALLYYKVEDVNSVVQKILERIGSSKRITTERVKEIIKSEMGERIVKE